MVGREILLVRYKRAETGRNSVGKPPLMQILRALSPSVLV